MTIADIEARHVIQALEEFDRLGRRSFLEKYGFRSSSSYWLLHEGRRYDSKAIIGAAHGYAKPSQGPMSAKDFRGGHSSLKPKLESLGFRIEGPPSTEESGNAFLLTWTEKGWDHAHILRMREDFEKHGFADEPWRIRSHRKAKPGDRVWVLKQGPGPKGIFGKGTISGPPFVGDAGNGKKQPMAPVRFSAFTDPRKGFLIGEAQTRATIPGKMGAQSSGNSLTRNEASALELLLDEGSELAPLIYPDEAEEEPFSPTTIVDARQRILKTITQRRGQKVFREALIKAYQGRCAISGCDVRDVLEAAHIHPYLGPQTNKVTNGLLLRADLHTLFDGALIEIDAENLTVIVKDRLRGSEYGAYHGQKLRAPRHPAEAPSREALKSRRDLDRSRLPTNIPET